MLVSSPILARSGIHLIKGIVMATVTIDKLRPGTRYVFDEPLVEPMTLKTTRRPVPCDCDKRRDNDWHVFVEGDPADTPRHFRGDQQVTEA